MKPILYKLLGRASDLADVEPLLALFLGAALLAVFLSAFLPAKSSPDPSGKSSLLWTLYGHFTRLATALMLVALLMATISVLRSYLRQAVSNFQRTHGRVTQANYNAVQTIWGAEQTQNELNVAVYHDEEVTERTEFDDPKTRKLQFATSHPGLDLLKMHDPEKFGCSPCHQGNGRATTSVEKAHGTYEHWLWPLFPKGNVEAGCQTCHSADMVLVSNDVGWTLNEGKDLFRQRGCMGCHRFEGYDKEPEDLLAIAQQLKQLDQEKKDNLKQSAYLMKQADAAATNEEANRLNDTAVALKVTNSKLELRIAQLDRTTKSLLQDMKKVGPNLKDIRLKLNKNWIPVWLKKPSDFRATTKMPNFRLNDAQIQSISAYLWQSALADSVPTHKRGSAAHGKELVETRGCLGCHSIGEGDQAQGGTFAANLTRVGEKDSYDYLVRWARRKYKRLHRHARRARQFLASVARREPGLFAHWRLVRP
jgi:cytochrome c551/c552